jgi:outer membrane biosynthesis protein TonB
MQQQEVCSSASVGKTIESITEANPMKLVGVISTAVLSLALGVAVPAFAQDHEQDEDKSKPAQEEKKAQPAKPEEKNAQEDKSAKPEEKNARQEDKNAKPEEKNAQQEDRNAKPAEKNAQQEHAAGNGDRIPAARYKASFGQQHTFRVSQGDYRNHRFQYGGYSFGFVDPWPSNWLYTQNVYVIEIDGVYYLCNPMYPGVNLALSFTL